MDDDEEGENAITYETFRKFQRKEKNNEKLQDLPQDFFKSCMEWINRKEDEFEEKRDSALLREIENVKKIVRDIFDRRRKKILLLALHSVRSKKVSKNLLPEEEEFFENTVKRLRKLEEDLLERVLEGEEPGAEDGEDEESEEIGNKGEEEIEGEDEEGVEDNQEEEKEEGGEEDEAEIEVEPGDGTKLVKVLEEVDQFVGTDEIEYGPLEEGDLVTLPGDVANFLIEREKAEASEV